GSAGEAERFDFRRQAFACKVKLQRWAKSCPDTFSCRYALVAAEIARVEKRDKEAAALYEEAIRKSGDGKFVHIEGLASELAGRFYLTRPSVVPSATYFRQARACYARWGATGKVRHLETNPPDRKA